MIRRKQRALVGFLMVYLAFFAMIAALVVFTPGLELGEKENAVFVKNNSVHIVKNVRVELADGTQIDCIEKLKPGEEKDLNVPAERRPVKIIAFAPFHPSAERTLLPVGEKGFRLQWSIEYEEPVKAGQEFELLLELCAENADLERLLVKESHNENIFKEQSKNRLVPVLKKGDCRRESFWLTPKQAGEAEIEFTLEAVGYGKKIGQKIMVE